jgi:aspartyl-tRNA(Asn)/glutamyl-tRNA(Gln) amidotransferase subunit C
MAEISKEQVEHIGLLARLELSKEEKEKFANQISSILNYVEQLDEVDTENIEPIANITGLENVMIADKVEKCEADSKELLSNVPAKEDNSIKVKAVLE